MHAPIYTTAKQKMEPIERIHNRLRGVDFIETAYTKARRAMDVMDEITGIINTSKDIQRIAQLSGQAKEALQIITQTYDELEQYDVAQPEEKTKPKNPSFKGTIRRKGSF